MSVQEKLQELLNRRLRPVTLRSEIAEVAKRAEPVVAKWLKEVVADGTVNLERSLSVYLRNGVPAPEPKLEPEVEAELKSEIEPKPVVDAEQRLRTAMLKQKEAKAAARAAKKAAKK